MVHRLCASCLAISILLSPYHALGQAQTKHVMSGRLISIERGEFNAIPLRGVRVTLALKGMEATVQNDPS